ncbi:4-oxalocrotonate tautomerase [Pseudomonas helleri]|nr:4-oxalocrotonate tautomerase [Pseudomonas helleri]MQU19705.1 4-oxalocrotonate tautomerase [Pseudomonas helleri]
MDLCQRRHHPGRRWQHRRHLVINEETDMPYVNIKVTDEGVSAEQKRLLIKGVTELLERVLNKAPSTTYVVIDEVSTDNWGVGGETTTQLRARQKLNAQKLN